jgi:nuclease-like protein
MLIVMTPEVLPAQQSTAPPSSSLSTIPLSPGENTSGRLPFCDLCRRPEPRAGSGLRSHRLPRDKELRPHKKPKGMHRSSRRSLRSLLPHHAPEPITTRERILESWQVQTIDGDTIRYGAERIRIRGLNAPELSEPTGEAARERLGQLLREGPIRIVPHGTDVYGRTVAEVFVNGQNVMELLAQERLSKPGS